MNLFISLQLIFAVCDRNSSIFGKGIPYLLSSITHVITLADTQERDMFTQLSIVKTEPMDVDMESRDEVNFCYIDMC